jgi:integrase
MSRPRSTPALTHHKASGQAVVRIDGRDRYCGPWGTPQANQKYHRLIAEWLGRQARAQAEGAAPGPIGIMAELAAAWLVHVQATYRKNGRPTSEVHCQRTAWRCVMELYADLEVEDFGPLKLKAVRGAMIRQGWGRRVINRQVRRIVQAFRWAAENELTPAALVAPLACVKGLRRGQGGRELPRVRPAPIEVLRAVQEAASPHVAAMLEVQWASGMRSGELVQLRAADLEMTGPVWIFAPSSWKTEHHDDDARRLVALGPAAQAALRPYLVGDPQAFLFQPSASERTRGDRVGDRFSAGSYRRAVHRACDRAWPLPAELARVDRETVSDWKARLGEAGLAAVRAWRRQHRLAPHRLRHSLATRARKDLGLDAARAALGHKSANTTLDYAEIDLAKAIEVARRIG